MVNCSQAHKYVWPNFGYHVPVMYHLAPLCSKAEPVGVVGMCLT